ncbi:MAG TPA: serine/threonine protein phosphatase [Clostridiales bacterium]|nr:serine/threonine protein phosphatase [Clostridiales bacterium]
MSLFAIADLHLSLGTNKPMDVFNGWNDYVSRLEQNWRAVVTENDTVVIAGDISWAMKLEETFKDFTFLESLPGKKLLLKGNHDYWWVTRKKIEDYLAANSFNSISLVFNSAKAVEQYAVCGTRGWFYEIISEEDKKILNREVGRLETSIKAALLLNKEPVVFLHYPPIYGDNQCTEILDILKKYNIKKCYYGHIHGGNAAKKAITGEYYGINFSLISCDYTGFVPLLVR